MIAKKEAGSIIKIYKTESNEIESFTMLHISDEEFNSLLKIADWKMGDDNILIAKYKYKDPLDLLWKDLASAHQKKNKAFFRDVSKDYPSSVSGTSVLIRDPIKHIIKIGYRNDNSTNRINRVCIDNERRDLFFRDCKKGNIFKTAHKYAIDLSDLDVYNYWSKYMNVAYIRGREAYEAYKKAKKANRK